MILVLRGHIRNSFKNNQLYELVKEISEKYPLKIYIHTWNIVQSTLSWRPLENDQTIVSPEFIYDYFKDLSPLIQDILIDDDKNISLIGNLEGNICKGQVPILGWKRYLYGKHQIIKHIFMKYMNEEIESDEPIVNTRFDVLSNSNNYLKEIIHEFIEIKTRLIFRKNHFIYDKECMGVDNIYIGNINTMNTIIYHFHHNLDSIIPRYYPIYNPERMFFNENNKFFSS